MICCVVCAKPLSGRQRKFCSRRCKNNYSNNRLQTYLLQQERGRKRKIDLVRLLGGCCQRCGYRKNYAALEFHHRDAAGKSFQLDLRSLSNRSWTRVLVEAEKCMLLCSNCHAEMHNPESDMPE